MAIRSDGKIVVAGASNASLNTSPDFALAVYRADGTLDTGFGGDGRVTTDFGSGNHAAYAVAWQSDGNIVAAGESNSDFALARYLGPLSGNANLSALTVNGSTDGTTYTALTGANAVLPAFDAGATSYRATVGNDVTAVNVVVELADLDSTAVVMQTSTGSTNSPVHLNLGDNEFTVRVTAPDGTTRDYTITVRRVPEGTVWHATLAVADLAGTTDNGCDQTAAQDAVSCKNSSVLTEDGFSVDERNYRVDFVTVSPSGYFVIDIHSATQTYPVSAVRNSLNVLNICVLNICVGTALSQSLSTRESRCHWW